MRVPRVRLRVVVFALSTVAAAVSFAQAPAPKSPDVQTVGGSTSTVTTTPVDLTAATSFVPPVVSPAPVPTAQPPKAIAPGAPAPVELAVVKEPAALPHAPNLADVFGRIPRREWTTGEPVKPADIVTTGPATYIEPASGAATPAPAPARATVPARAKPAEKTTSLPRDPAAPAPAPGKTAGQEVKR